MEAGTEVVRRRRAPSGSVGRDAVDRSRSGGLAVGWGLGATVLVFATSVARLGARGIETMRAGLDSGEWIALAVITALFVYGEGVRGLQRRWIPAVLRRTADLRAESTPNRLLAPLYVMMLVGAPGRTLWRAWAGVAAIVAAVFIVRALPDPWRGITDFAVACALGWGLLVILAGIPSLVARTSE